MSRPCGTAARVRIAAWPTRQDGLAAHPPGVHRPEGGGGEGGEHARMASDRLGNALATGQPGAHQLAGVPLVDGRAGGADGLAAVAACDVQHSPGIGGGVVDRGGLARDQVDGLDPAGEPDGVGAVAGGGELAFPGFEVGPGDGFGVVGGRPQPRARDGFGAESGGRGVVVTGCPSVAGRPGG